MSVNSTNERKNKMMTMPTLLLTVAATLQSTIALGACKVSVISENGKTTYYTADKGMYFIPKTSCQLTSNDDNNKRSPFKRRFLACAYTLGDGFTVKVPIVWHVRRSTEEVILHVINHPYSPEKREYIRVRAFCSGY